MARHWKKTLIIGASLALGLFGALLAYVELGKDRTFDAPYPTLRASQDPKLIERGRYLAYGPAHCVDCHRDSNAAGEAESSAPLSGGLSWQLPPGVFTAKNITPDKETGIGKYSDAELARLLRYGVRPDGRAAIPFMRFENLSDEDLVAVLSFLRAQAPVRHAVADNEVNLLGDAVLALALTPTGPSSPPPQRVEATPSPEYGRYLAENVAGCITCHTRIDMRTGQRVGPDFAGGAEHPARDGSAKVFIAPNLTPHSQDGWLEGWSEDAFVSRMKAGPVHVDSPMPWRAYQLLSETDARALFRFLRSLPAASGGPDPKVRVVVAATAP